MGRGSKEVICPYCGKAAEWVSNDVIYGKRYGKSYMVYLCRLCDAYVGCHENTRKPLGTLANKKLRLWRRSAHKAIDPLWKGGSMTRGSVYRMLDNHFGAEIHVGESNANRCKAIISYVEKLTKKEG